MRITLDDFEKKWLGEKCDWDNYYGGQCVDLYRQYVNDVLDYPQSPGVGGAAEIWDSADPEYYDFIDNGLYTVPQRGDIIVWNRKAGGGFGHVAIYLSGDVNKFVSLDQNWPTLSVVTKTEHNYTSIIGWMRPKRSIDSDKIYSEAEMTITREQRDDNHRKFIAMEETANARKKTYEEFKEKLTKKLFLPIASDEADILGSVERGLKAEDDLTKANKTILDNAKIYEDKEKAWQEKFDNMERDFKHLERDFIELKRQRAELDETAVSKPLVKPRTRFQRFIDWILNVTRV